VKVEFLAVCFGCDGAAREGFQVARTDACAGSTAPVVRLGDCYCYFDQAAALGALILAGDLGVLGEGVEAWHEGIEDGEEVVERRLGGGEGVEQL
jgi:hypothetical protein